MMANNDAGDTQYDIELPELPEVPMRHILAKLPTADLLSTDLVSTSWSTHTQRETTLNRPSLCLYLGDETLARGARDCSKFDMPFKEDLLDITTGKLLFPDYTLPSEQTWEHIKAAKLTDDLMMQLLKLFPEPTSLIVSLGPRVVSENLLILLSAWSGSLTSFKLYAPLEPLPAEEDEEKLLPEPAKRLLSVINSMSSLRHLTVDWGDQFLPNNFLHKLNLPILSHLEELYFYSQDDVDDLVPSLAYGKSNENLRVIALPGYLDKKYGIAFSHSADFLTRFKQLNFSLRGSDRDWSSRQPSDSFSALTLLKLTINPFLDWTFGLDGGPLSLADFLGILVPMKELLHLELTLSTADVSNWLRELSQMQAMGYENFDELQDGHGNWLAVPSLKVLSLAFTPDPKGNFGAGVIESHHDLRALQLHRFFPSVQVLSLSIETETGFSCNSCLDKYTDFKDWKDACIPPMVNSAHHFKDLVFVEAKSYSANYFNTWDPEDLEDEDDWDSGDDDLNDADAEYPDAEGWDEY